MNHQKLDNSASRGWERIMKHRREREDKINEMQADSDTFGFRCGGFTITFRIILTLCRRWMMQASLSLTRHTYYTSSPFFHFFSFNGLSSLCLTWPFLSHPLPPSFPSSWLPSLPFILPSLPTCLSECAHLHLQPIENNRHRDCQANTWDPKR